MMRKSDILYIIKLLEGCGLTMIKAIILAAGKGTRMKSNIPKVMHKVNGMPMLVRIFNTLSQVGISTENLITVLGDKKEYIIKNISEISYVVQEEQLGTGHAVKIAKKYFENFDGGVIITYGDAPLIKKSTYDKLIFDFNKGQSGAVIVTTHLENPFGYGRVIKNAQGEVERVVEEKDASVQEKKITEINTGLYCINAKKLAYYIEQVKNNNVKNEYYLTDVVELMYQAGEGVSTLEIEEFEQMVGVNDKVQLAEVSEVLRREKNRELMESGVILIDPSHTYIEESVQIGQDTVVYPNTFITGDTHIGTNTVILEGSRIENSKIGSHVKIKSSVIEESIVEDYSDVGPFAHLRPLAHLKEHVHVGNFVEVKKSTLEKGVKCGHLTYIGDASVGEGTNIGCGTITCNYDGKKKYQTIIGKNNFIGSDTIFVAPVKTGDNVLVGAGTVLNRDIPSDCLVVGRPALTVKENYFKK